MPDTDRDDAPSDSHTDPSVPTPEPGETRAHRVAVWTLIGVATIVLILTTLNAWVERQLLETDNWVETSSALLEDDTVRHEVAAYLVNTVYSEIDVGDAVSERLPEDLAGLGGLLAGALRDPLIDSVDALLDTEAVKSAWASANRKAHETVVAVLEGEELAPGVTTADGRIVLDLGALVEQVAESLGRATGVGRPCATSVWRSHSAASSCWSSCVWVPASSPAPPRPIGAGR